MSKLGDALPPPHPELELAPNFSHHWRTYNRICQTAQAHGLTPAQFIEQFLIECDREDILDLPLRVRKALY